MLLVEAGAFVVVVPLCGRALVAGFATLSPAGASSLSEVDVELGMRGALGVIVSAALFGIRLRIVERSRALLAGAVAVIVRLALVTVVLDVGLQALALATLRLTPVHLTCLLLPTAARLLTVGKSANSSTYGLQSKNDSSACHARDSQHHPRVPLHLRLAPHRRFGLQSPL